MFMTTAAANLQGSRSQRYNSCEVNVRACSFRATANAVPAITEPALASHDFSQRGR
jgi:hypothetical protein